MVLDIWLHHHKHGTDVYPFFRKESTGLHSEEAVIEHINRIGDFDLDPTSGEFVELSLSGHPVPKGAP